MEDMIVKALWLAPLIVGTLTAPVTAQEIKLGDLANITIESTVWRTQTGLHDGKEYSGKIKSDLEIVAGKSGDPVQFTQTNTWFDKTGRRRTMTYSGSGLPGKPSSVSRGGDGHRVAFLEKGTIYIIRTYKTGGFKSEIKLSRTSNVLTCTSREVYMNEKGADAIRLNSYHTGRPVVVLYDKQISSTCRVIKR